MRDGPGLGGGGGAQTSLPKGSREAGDSWGVGREEGRLERILTDEVAAAAWLQTDPSKDSFH